MFEPMPMVVSPSPLELHARLADEEKVAIDLILDDVDENDERLCALVPTKGRRSYLRALAIQLPACIGDVALDKEAKAWADEARRVEQRAQAEAEARDRAWLETLPVVARRSVERKRRRRAARRGRQS
jgi:hypothetical protein